MNILLAEDDTDLGETLVSVLEEAGFSVRWAKTGSEVFYFAETLSVDLLILDRMLPELEGLDVLRRVRKQSDVPVLVLTALNTLDHRVEGLDAGADDYLGKPFEIVELLARVRALVRRAPREWQSILTHGDITLDSLGRRVTRRGEAVDLTHAELQAFEYLLKNRGRVISREQLEILIYDDRDLRANPVDVLIHRIRKKLGRDLIRTRRGYGYLIEGKPGKS